MAGYITHFCSVQLQSLQRVAKLLEADLGTDYSGLLTIWEYFCTTKEVDVQWTQLVEEMNTWAKQHKVQINSGVSLQQINDG